MPNGIGGELGWWCPSLDNSGNGTTTLNDLSGNGFNGTLTNMDAATDWVPDTSNGGVRVLDFDGGNDHVRCGNVSSLNGLSQMSISCWVGRNATLGSFQVFLARGSSDSSRIELMTSFDANGLLIAIGNGANTYNYTSSAIFSTLNQLRHICVLFDGTQATDANRLKVYIDNSQVSVVYATSLPTTTPTNSAVLTLGAQSYPNLYAKMRMDDIRFYNRILTTAEIANLYSKRGYEPPLAGGRLLGGSGPFENSIFGGGGIGV